MKKRARIPQKRQTQSKRKARKTKRITPIVSKAKGGLLPGVDLTRFSDYQAMEDLEYVERMRHFK
jgi:hypothetical protein